jgi:hypothetical protein
MSRIGLFFILLSVSSVTFAQKNVPALERQVTLTILNEPISSVLEQISKQSGVKFSYNPATVKVDSKVSLSVSGKPIRSVLNELFDETIQYKQNGIYIILTYKTPKPVSPKAVIKELNIQGYIYSEQGLPIEAASIYNAENLIASVSNEFGYYNLSIPANRFPITLKVAKEQYKDTSIRVMQQYSSTDIILVSPKKKTAPPPLTKDTILVSIDTTRVPDTNSVHLQQSNPDSISQTKSQRFFQQLLLSDGIKTNLRNISDTFFTKTQIGLLPFVSTNKLLSGNTVNDYSFNVLVGYSQGVNVFEIGGLINIDRGNVQSFQAAGLMNAVGGNVQGVQLAGWGNVTKGKSDGIIAGGIFNVGTDQQGVQLAGICNVNLSYPDSFSNLTIAHFSLDTVDGIQAAGIVNVNAGHTNGIRMAGILNLGNTNTGMQMAGILNANRGKSEGVNIAGLLNIMNDSSLSSDISGLINTNHSYKKGLQVAGLANVNRTEMIGVQVSSILNISKQHTGTQIGFLNVSDSIDGIPIGFISIVNKGYHKIELFADDVLQTQLAFRTGVPLFHNIFTIGIDMTNRLDGLWSFGYGVGSTFKIGNTWSINSDILAQNLITKANFENTPLLASCFIGIEKRFHRNFSIALGPVYHAYFQYGQDDAYSAVSEKLIPYSFSEKTSTNGNSLNMWVGGKLSFTFL